MLVRRVFVGLLAVSALLSASVATAQNKGTFQAGVNHPAGPPTVPSNTGFLGGGILPLEVHTGDFNGDGKPDVVVAAACTSGSGIANCPASGYAVAVYLDNGDGSFHPAIVSSGPAPSLRSIAVGDFNGDGKLDVAAASDCLSDSDCSSGTMVILLGNGDGTFTGTGVTYPLGGIVSQPNTITVGDLNGDGKADIVVTLACAPVVSPCQGAVSVYLGNGDGSFQTPNTYPTTGNGAIPVAIGDFNKDGKPDVLVATPGSNVVFFPGNGDGTLGTPSSTTLPNAGQSIAVGDFNGDGNLDVAVGGFVFAMVAFGNGDGTFQTPTSYDLNANFATSIVAADMNGDGKLDLIVGGGQGTAFNNASLLLNDGTGNFANLSNFPLGGSNLASVGVTDFNGDGKNDVVLVSMCPEIGNNCPDGTLSVLLGNGDGTMRSARYVPEGNDAPRPAVAAADFNGDGFQDLIFASGCGAGASCTPSGFTLLLADGAGGYQAPLVFTAPVKQSHFLAVGDFNHDGKPDVAVFNDCDASCTGSSVSIFLNTGNGTFAPPVVYESGGAGPVTITTGDFNGDGKLDIALLLSDSGLYKISILLGNGDGTFQSAVTTFGDSTPAWWMAAADFNGDGKTDLALAHDAGSLNPSDPHEGLVLILLSNGDGMFTFFQSYASSGEQSLSIATGDVNGDGKQDIVIGNLCDSPTGDASCARGIIGVLLGNGDGTFTFGPTQIEPDANMYAMALADVNGDGKLDAIASTETGILVSFGNGDGSFQGPTVYAALRVAENVQLAVADLNDDGGLDVVQPGDNGQLAILYNQGFSKPATSVALQSSLSTSTYGQLVTFTATVHSASGTPTGNVSFLVDGNPAGAGTLTNGLASFQTTALTAGTHSVTASYSGSDIFQPSNSATLNQVVNKETSATLLSSNVNPSYVTQTVFFNVQVVSSAATGNVTFMDGVTPLATVPLLRNTNRAAFSTTFTTTGTHSITAVYSGDSNNLGSTSPVLKQVVKALPAVTTTGLTTSGTPVFIGQSVTFVATVFSTFGRIPVGELVTFSDGTTVLATVPLTVRGQATFTTSALKAATHTIKASYPGDTNFKPSSGLLKQVVSLYPSSVSAPGSSLNPSVFGQPVTLTVTVTSTAPSTPTGTVTFKNGAATLGTAILDPSGVATLTKANLPAGALSITAIYNGDSETAKSTSAPLTQTVNQATTAIALTSSQNPSTAGQLVKFTATVTSPTTTPTGSVTLMDGSTALAVASLVGGKATLSTSLSSGTHSLSAVYGGTANITGSTSALLVQTVN